MDDLLTVERGLNLPPLIVDDLFHKSKEPIFPHPRTDQSSTSSDKTLRTRKLMTFSFFCENQQRDLAPFFTFAITVIELGTFRRFMR